MPAGVAVTHQPLKACLEVNAMLEVHQGGWPSRDGAEGASWSAQSWALTPARSTVEENQARMDNFLTSA